MITALLSASTAHALNQSKHFDVTVASCTHAGLPSAFCNRVGAEVYDVDANEFNDLSAHSQIPVGTTACDAANASLWREFWLGGQVRASILAVGYQPSASANGQLAQQLGRALHTVQDNCAHSGMPNPQHAWHSLSDVCRGTTESPDVQTPAYGCAANETDAIFSAFVDVLHDGGADFASLTSVDDEEKHWPAYGDVCSFLGSAGDWDGEDRRWDGDVVRAALTDRFVRALNGADSSQFAYVCTGYDNGVERAYSDSTRDTSGGAQSCVKIHAFCLGKADGAAPNAEPPPYEANDPAPTPATAASMHGGCSAAPGAPTSSAATPLALLIVAFLLLRRRDVV
ncbi:MAG TPA: MYXO-CTERM sorting domain-containing protein [Polyangia bacterium]